MKPRERRESNLLKWFNLRGVPDEWLQDEIIDNYCHANNYTKQKIELCERDDKIFFIQNHFEHFRIWAHGNYKLL